MKLDLMLLESVLTMLLQIESFLKIFFVMVKIFLIFDPTHIIKNIYNNLVNRRVFEMRSMTPILDSPLTASFADIVKVYNLECQKPLRIAYCLTETVLKPNNIEKVNVKFALVVFHESTVIANVKFALVVFHESTVIE